MWKLTDKKQGNVRIHIPFYRYLDRLGLLRSRLFTDITKVGLGDFLGQIINASLAVILIRGLTITDYASFSAMNSVASLSAGVVGSGINLALVRFSADYASRTGKKLSSLYYIVLVVEIVLFLVISLISLLFPKQAAFLVLGQPGFEISLQFGLLYGMGLLLTQLGRSVYQAEEKFGRFVMVLLLRQGVTLIVIGLLWLFKGLTYQTAAMAIAGVYSIIGAWIFSRSSEIKTLKQIRASFLEGRPFINQFLSTTGWLIGYFFLITVITQVDTLTLTRFTPKTELAIYGVALRYYSMALLFLGSINSVLLPKFSRLEMQNPDKQKSFTIQWIKMSAWLIIPIVLFDIFGKDFFVWINGYQYEKAFLTFVVFSVGVWLSFILSPLTNILIARGDFRYMFVIGLFALLYCVFGNLILVPLFGGLGAAIIMVTTHNIVLQIPILARVLSNKKSSSRKENQNKLMMF